MTRRAAWATVSITAVALMLAPTVVPLRPVLIWNATASTPVGLYAIRDVGRLHVGQLLAVLPPEPIASFLARGGFLPRGVLLLKHVAAVTGDTICRAGDTITIDGIFAGAAHDLDSRHRPLPRWSGCRTLSTGQVFLMNPSVRDSLDGRYFGPLPVTSIIGQATPLWVVSRANDRGPVVERHPTLFLHPTERTSP